MLEGTFTTTDATELAIHDFGGAGDDLLLVHGVSLCAEMLSPMAEHLGAHRAAGVDLRGHGSSARPPTRDYSFERMGRDLGELLDAAKAPVRAFGHSAGASALLLAALERPERFRSLCLFEPILLDARAAVGLEEMARHAEGRRSVFTSRAEAEEHFSSRGVFATFDREVLAGFVDGGLRPLPDGSFELALSGPDEAAIYRSSVEDHIWDGVEVLPKLDLELTILTGGETKGPTLVGSRRLAKLDPRVRVVKVEGVDHFGPFVQPKLLGELVSTIFDTSST